MKIRKKMKTSYSFFFRRSWGPKYTKTIRASGSTSRLWRSFCIFTWSTWQMIFTQSMTKWAIFCHILQQWRPSKPTALTSRLPKCTMSSETSKALSTPSKPRAARPRLCWTSLLKTRRLFSMTWQTFSSPYLRQWQRRRRQLRSWRSFWHQINTKILLKNSSSTHFKG